VNRRAFLQAAPAGITAVHPNRVRAAVMIGGYSIQNVFAPQRPAPPKLSVSSGISGISTRSAEERDWRPIAAAYASCCGRPGRPAGASAMKGMIARRYRSTMPILWLARRVIADAGHFLPREKPEAVSAALLELLQR